jgi:hypothetical protein
MGGEETEKEERKIEASLATTPAFNPKSKVTQSQRDKFKVSPLSLSRSFLPCNKSNTGAIVLQFHCGSLFEHERYLCAITDHTILQPESLRLVHGCISELFYQDKRFRSKFYAGVYVMYQSPNA